MLMEKRTTLVLFCVLGIRYSVLRPRNQVATFLAVKHLTMCIILAEQINLRGHVC